MIKYPKYIGMRVFILIWFGQLVSSIGSSLTDFALGLWVYQRTGSISQFILISVSSALPLIVMSPLAGVLADRWNRRWAMILSDSASALGTIVIALLIATNRIEIWHIHVATAMSSTFYAYCPSGDARKLANAVAYGGRPSCSAVSPMVNREPTQVQPPNFRQRWHFFSNPC